MNLIKLKRIELKMTQEKFAKKIGVPKYKISRMENGVFSLNDACAFCNEFKEFHIKEMAIQKI